MSRDWCSAAEAGIRLTVQITPNAKKSEVIGVIDDALKIRLQAQPVEGKANLALIRYLAGALGVPKSTVSIVFGHTGKRKIIDIGVSGLGCDDVRRRLTPALG